MSLLMRRGMMAIGLEEDEVKEYGKKELINCTQN